MTFTSPSRVEDLLNFRLNRLLASSGAMVTRLCEGRYGITRREWRMICILAAQGPLSPSELAEHAHLERARVSRHVTDLVSKNLIERLAVDTDKRRARLQLNQRGRDVFEAGGIHADVFGGGGGLGHGGVPSAVDEARILAGRRKA